MGIKDFLTKNKGAASPSKDTDYVKLRGFIDIEHLGADGRLKAKQKIENTVVYVGKYLVASLLANKNSLSALNYMALGSDATAAAVGQSLLIAELTGANASGAARVQCSIATVNVSAPAGLFDTVQAYYSFSLLQSMQIQEVGMFNLSGANNGQMLGRQTVTAINGQPGDTVNVTYKFQF